MKSIVEQPSKTKFQLKKPNSLSNFNTKRIRQVLTSRPTMNQIMEIKKKPSVENLNGVSSKTININNKSKKKLLQISNNIEIKRPNNKHLMEIIKPTKFQKTSQQSALIKNCNKTKLIYWNNELVLKGTEKYIVISSDFILDQDCFWDKLSSDNGNSTITQIHLANTLSTINHNLTLKSKNFTNTNSKSSYSNYSIGANQQCFRKNPLLNPNQASSLTKEWKSLHSKIDPQNRKVIVVWMIKKQSSYTQMMQFVQFYQLPLHAVFYLKRKRINSFFDLNPIVKQIYQRYFQSIINPKYSEQEFQTTKLISTQKIQNPKSKQLLSQMNKQFLKATSQQLKNNFIYMTNRPKYTKKTQTNQYNDQNSINLFNQVQNFKQFEISKNKNHIDLIKMSEYKKIMKKIHPSSASRIRSTTVKMNEIIHKNQTQIDLDRQKRDISPELIENTQTNLSIQLKITKKIQNKQKQQSLKYFQPQIFIFEGIKCNSKDFCDDMTYKGKIPLLFDYHKKRFQILRNKLIVEMGKGNIQIIESKQKSLSICYINYQNIQYNILQQINQISKNILKQNSQSQVYYKIAKVDLFSQNLIESVLTQFLQEKQQKSTNNRNFQQNQNYCKQLNQEQQQICVEKTEKKLQEIKKQLINGVIAAKGRNYTFQNGQSVYYYVGDIFKRNYNLLYNEYYKVFQKQLINIALGKSKRKNNKKTEHSRQTECSSPSIFNIKKSSQLQLSKFDFFQLRIS